MELFIELLSPGILWILFALLSAFILVVTVTLSYHWKEYSVDSQKRIRFFGAYLLVLLVLLGVMAISIWLYGT